MTKEQEVEEIVKQVAHQALALHLPGEVYDAYTSWLRQQLTSLAEKAEEQGVKKATSKAGWPAVVIEGWMKKGAQEMKEKAIECVGKEILTGDWTPTEIEAAICLQQDILTALQALTDE